MPNAHEFKKKNLRSWDSNIASALKIEPSEPQKHIQTDNPSNKEYIQLINPNDISNWKFNDRPESELGDLNALANDMKINGQQQPCTVRPLVSDNHKYELIIGERRWRASKIAEIPLKAVVKELSDNQAAISQAVENDNRLDLSDYAKGISFAKLIDDGVITQKDLTEKLSKSKQYISALLSYSKIPDIILNNVSNWSNVSSRTAEKIKQLSSKGDDYIQAIIGISDLISSKKIGHSELERKVLSKINHKINGSKSNKIYTKDGRHIFTWRQDNNSLPSIHFPKHLNKLFEESKINKDQFTENLINLVQQELKSINDMNNSS